MGFMLVRRFEDSLKKTAPYMQSTVSRARGNFGPAWEGQFEETLQKIFGNDEKKMEDAIQGYVRFALDATKLQKRFEKEKQYIPKNYEEASRAVYHNRDYMRNLYLPGILLSHYLWPHHYRQLVYFHKKFIPMILSGDDKRFCDVGLGTGFYSRQILSVSEQIHGKGYDISEHSINYSKMQINAFGWSGRWECSITDIIKERPDGSWPFMVCVEVLEHLEDPLTFLKALRAILQKGGVGFITAAITAPNADHIYLYNNCEEVIAQITEAGFSVIEYLDEMAYEPKKDEPVPRLGAFIVK